MPARVGPAGSLDPKKVARQSNKPRVVVSFTHERHEEDSFCDPGDGLRGRDGCGPGGTDAVRQKTHALHHRRLAAAIEPDHREVAVGI